MPFTNPYPGPRSVLIMDNCSMHHGEQIRQLVKDEYCKCHPRTQNLDADITTVTQSANSSISCHTHLIITQLSKHFLQSKHSSIVTSLTRP